MVDGATGAAQLNEVPSGQTARNCTLVVGPRPLYRVTRSRGWASPTAYPARWSRRHTGAAPPRRPGGTLGSPTTQRYQSTVRPHHEDLRPLPALATSPYVEASRRLQAYDAIVTAGPADLISLPAHALLIVEEHLRDQEREGVRMPEGIPVDELALRVPIAAQVLSR